MSFRRPFYSLYWFMRRFIAPGLEYSQVTYEKVLTKELPGKKCLDIGCGHHLLPPWRSAEERELISQCSIVGLDCCFNSLKKHRSIDTLVRGSATCLPFADNAFDVITANMVVEHLDCPCTQLKEIYRVLKPGGVFIFHTPNTYGYSTVIARLLPDWIKPFLVKVLQGRSEDDTFKTHYMLNSKRSIKNACSESGFLQKEVRMISSDAIFVVVPPLAAIELFVIRILMFPSFSIFRSNIIAFLQKPL